MNATAHTAPEVVVIVSQLHPRVCYAMETVLGDFLGLRPRLVLESNAQAIAAAQAASLPIFHYGILPSEHFYNLPCNGLLYEDIIRQANEQIDWFGAVSAQMKLTDQIAQIFYHITQYALLRPASRIKLDQHGRYPDCDGRLVVHELLGELRQALRPYIPDFPSGPAFDYEITIDVDQPWKYLHKPWHVRWGGWLRARMRGTDHRARWQALRSGIDPFDQLATIQEICPAAKTKVFFLVGGDHPNDSRFDITQAAYQEYVLAYQRAGFELGIHPSYEAVDRPALLPAQKAALEGVIGPVHISRQHYLRYRTPDTLRQLAAAGITRDYTLCLSASTGAPTGVALPYRWFDLQRNAATSLTLAPAVVMDRTLQQYMQLDPSQAAAAIAEQIARVRAVGGRFVIILHNETFSDVGEWTGWQAVIRQMLQLLEA